MGPVTRSRSVSRENTMEDERNRTRLEQTPTEAKNREQRKAIREWQNELDLALRGEPIDSTCASRPPIWERDDATRARYAQLWDLDNLDDVAKWSAEDKASALSLFRSVIRDYAAISEERNVLAAKYHEGLAQAQSMNKEIDETQEALDEARREITRLGSQTPAAPDTMNLKKSAKLPDPKILTDGKDPYLEDWLSDMRRKLKANHDH